ncbi:MAG TPA: ABC transporter permease subunit [Candidatus Dormibacteraeota bacterium]|nr:ABC transporter permease subunit [Candidatus Dormibacteraeota bacterium]
MGLLAASRRRALSIFPVEGILATALFLVAWQVVSLFMNQTLLPGPVKVAAAVWHILSTPAWLGAAGVSYLRVLAGLLGGFLIGTAIALVMMLHRRAAVFVTTYLTFIQGVPSLCWVVMAILWFRDVETRIWFILVMVTLPGFALQIYDGYRSIPHDLKEMLRSLRPNPLQRVRYLYVPALVAPVLTIWKISLGIGIRVVLVAELVGGTLGIGFQLAAAQMLINMALVLAWTALLVAFVLVTEKLVSLLEAYALRWRPEATARRERMEAAVAKAA